MTLEVCIDSLESALNAYNGGADELEVCSSLHDGGLTPSMGLVNIILQRVPNAKLNIMIRCRPGSDFNYSEHEIETMLSDVDSFKQCNINSYVFGALTSDLKLDKEVCGNIISRAHPVPVSLHRAFDMTSDPLKEMNTAIELNFKRILTSGKCSQAHEEKARMLIKSLVVYSDNAIEIMPGSGVNPSNIKSLVQTGAKHFHSSCKVGKKISAWDKVADQKTDTLYFCDETTVRELKQKVVEYVKNYAELGPDS